MATAKIALPLPGTAPYQQRAATVLPILVQRATRRQTIEYGELASAVGISNPRNLNYPLGCIGQTLLQLSKAWGTRIPPIQCLVVNKSHGRPSEGISEFLSDDRDFTALPEAEKVAVIQNAQRSVFSFTRWRAVLAALNLTADAREFTSDQYKAALVHAPLRPHHRQLLKAHLATPERTVTATELARMLGYASYKAANLHYGQLGALVCKQLDWKPLPSQTVSSIVTFEKRSGEWHWIMRPEVVVALEQLGWGGTEDPCFPEELSTTERYIEGAVRTIKVNAYERSRAARSQCLAHHGCACAVCDLQLADRYGEAVRGLIHVHHVRPLAEVSGRYEVDPIRDLRPVCPTCHAVIHARQPAFTIQEVRRMLATTRKRAGSTR